MAKPRQCSSIPRGDKLAGMKRHGRSTAERRGHSPLAVPSAGARARKLVNVISSPDLDPKPRSPVPGASQDDKNDLPGIHPTSAHPSSIHAPAVGTSLLPALEEPPAAKRRKIALDMSKLVNKPALMAVLFLFGIGPLKWKTTSLQCVTTLVWVLVLLPSS